MADKIKNNGKEVIDLQIKALKKLKSYINSSFVSCVKLISECKSKVIICGVGKSGKIASKIASTLSSIGTPAFSVSASDCSHGDLGRITKQDILILISNSGNTEELKNIIKYAKDYKIKIIGIVSNKESELYKSSDLRLFIPKVEESGHGIVPTSSTTSQLAIGDALSIAVMKKNKFTSLDFKKFHPSGNLAKKLKTALDVMLKDDKIPFINENETMKKALKLLNEKKLGFLVVTNKKGFFTGIFTDGDLKRLLQKKEVIGHYKIKKFMTKKPFAVEENVLITDILKLMNKKKITGIFVYKKQNKKKIVGVIHIHNILNLIN